MPFNFLVGTIYILEQSVENLLMYMYTQSPLILMPCIDRSGHIGFVLSVSLSFVYLLSTLIFAIFCLSVVNFNLRYNFLTVWNRDFIFWHAYSNKDALSNDTKVDEIVTLTMTFELKIVFFLTLLPQGA